MSGYSSDEYDHLSDVEQDTNSQKMEETSETHQEPRNDVKEDGPEDVSVNNERHELVKLMHENQGLLDKCNELTSENQKMRDSMEELLNVHQGKVSRLEKDFEVLKLIETEIANAFRADNAANTKTGEECEKLKKALKEVTEEKETAEHNLHALFTKIEALRHSEELERHAKEEFEQKAKKMEEEMLSMKTSKLEADLMMEKFEEQLKMAANSNRKLIEQTDTVWENVGRLMANLESMEKKVKEEMDRMNEELEREKEESRKINEKLKAEKKSIGLDLHKERMEHIKLINHNERRNLEVCFFFLIFALLVIFNVFYFLLK